MIRLLTFKKKFTQLKNYVLKDITDKNYETAMESIKAFKQDYADQLKGYASSFSDAQVDGKKYKDLIVKTEEAINKLLKEDVKIEASKIHDLFETNCLAKQMLNKIQNDIFGVVFGQVYPELVQLEATVKAQLEKVKQTQSN